MSAGFIVVDKPPDITSHGVVARMRGIAGTRKVGHGGTLDPMATGVLVIALGKATKLLTYVSGLDKSYTARVRLGQATVTDDAEGDITATHDPSAITDEQIESALAPMRGSIQQRPSNVSAIKINGERAYKRVRAGEEVEIPSREVTISRLDCDSIHRGEFLDVDITVDCSSGTYIRAIARDAGEALGVGGHLTSLRRTRVGEFWLSDAATLDALQQNKDAGETLPMLQAGEVASRLMPTREATDEEEKALSYGQSLSAVGITSAPYAVLNSGGELLAIVAESGERAKPEVVFKAQGG